MPLDLTLAYIELQKKKQNIKKFNKELSDEFLILQKQTPKIFSLTYNELISQISQKSNPC